MNQLQDSLHASSDRFRINSTNAHLLAVCFLTLYEFARLFLIA